MKVAIVFNRNSKKVINLFGVPNQEKYGLKSIQRILDALKGGGHQAIALEGDKNLIDRLEEFMPRVLTNERPGMVFNLSYGIQGQARYTHVPGMLEMMGVPYVGSGPLAHSLALDKVVTKMILKQHGIPTPDFAVVDGLDGPLPELTYPLIVKPKDEAVSFGIRIVNDEKELREGAQAILDKFQKPVLVEQYIAGREVNVGLLGNNPPEALPPAELVFGDGPQIYTYEDKTRKSGREVQVQCPADLPKEVQERAQEMAVKAFNALGCYDCARVDMRLDDELNVYILEVNSLPSMGEHGSYVNAAHAVGLDFPKLVNRLVDVASARYFGTPRPPQLGTKKTEVPDAIFGFLTERRDRIEKRLAEWISLRSRTNDPVGIRSAVKELDNTLLKLGMFQVSGLGDERSVWAWRTEAGLEDGTLIVGHLDIPVQESQPFQSYRREPELLFGEGIGSSRASLTMLEFTLRALKNVRLLKKLKLGVMYYLDEGRDARYSGDLIRQAAAKAKQVLVLRPGGPDDHIVDRRRGHRKFRFSVEASSAPPIGSRKPDAFRWMAAVLEDYAKYAAEAKRSGCAAVDVRTSAFPMRAAHRVEATLHLSHSGKDVADALEEKMRQRLVKSPFSCQLDVVADRPAMREHKVNGPLVKAYTDVAERWDIPLQVESSSWPSVAGLVPQSVPVLCGLGPVATGLYTPQEAIQRITLIQRTLLLAHFLANQAKAK